MDVRTALVQLREELNMRQTDFAAALGISAMTVNRWETGKNPPSRAMALAIVAYADTHKVSKVCQAALRETLLCAEEKPGIDSLKYAELAQINSLVNDSSNAVFVVDTQTYELLYANRAMGRISHKPLELAAHQKCYQYLYGKNRPCEFCAGGTFSDREFSSIGYESPVTGRYYVSRAKRIKWTGREAYINYISDMTDFHKAEKELAHQRELMSSACEQAQMWMLTMDLQTGTVWLEPTVQQLLRVGAVVPNFLDGLIAKDAVLAAYAGECHRVVAELKNGEKLAQAVVRTKILSKRVHWVRFRAKTVEYDAHGAPLLAVCSAQMIDEEMALRDRIRFEHEQIIGSRKDLMCYAIFDITQNRVLESRHLIDQGPMVQPGMVYAEAIQIALGSIQPDEDRDHFAAIHKRELLLAQFGRGELEQSIEYQLVQPDGQQIWVHDEMKLMLHPETGNVVLYEYCYAVHTKKIIRGLLNTILKNGYDALGAISLANDQVARLQFTAAGELIDHGLTFDSYTAQTAAYCASRVAAEEQAAFLSATAIERVREKLNDKDVYRVAYHEQAADGTTRAKVSDYFLCDRKYQFCLLTVWDLETMRASISFVDGDRDGINAEVTK